jgi:hypothetical protein
VLKKKTIQLDMTKIPFHGYTIQDGSSTIFIFGPFGCGGLQQRNSGDDATARYLQLPTILWCVSERFPSKAGHPPVYRRLCR